MRLALADEMREMDRMAIREFGIPGRVLMESAGRGAVRVLTERVPDVARKSVGVLCGRGNNGGDGFVMARYLADRGAAVRVYLLSGAAKVLGEAGENLALLGKMGVPVEEIPDEEAFLRARPGMERHQVWVDALLGTGLSSEVRGVFRTAVDFVNSRDAFVFSVDIPSGVSSDTGEILGAAVRARATATFGLAKVGHFLYPGRECAGRLCVVDIGIPSMIVDRVGTAHFALTNEFAKNALVPRAAGAHKGDAGRLLVVGGSRGKSGAAAMAALAAMRTGAGLVTLAGPGALAPGFQAGAPEVMALPLDETPGGGLAASAAEKILKFAAGCDGLALGPGLGTDEETVGVVRRVVRESPVPVVLDADGLNAVAGELDAVRKAGSRVILTPHPGEMARLCGVSTAEIQKDRVGRARELAKDLGCVCVLKGAATVVALPHGEVWINTTGNPGMASGGMGDVLTGVAAGFLVQGYAPETAARLAVFLHGLAGDNLAQAYGPVGFLAGDLIREFPRTLGRFLGPFCKG